MKAASLMLLLFAVTLAVFTLLNWTAIATPTAVSVGFTTIQAPLGLMLLIGSGLLAATFIVVIVLQQASSLAQARRFARDLRGERELAERAEASRLADLRAEMGSECVRSPRQQPPLAVTCRCALANWRRSSRPSWPRSEAGWQPM